MREISSITRRDLFDKLINDMYNEAPGWHWAGRFEEPDFLDRLYPVEELPSSDGRFPNAYSDIWQHCVNNPNDWQPDWIFNDERFELRDGNDEVLLNFLCEIIHPEVIKNQSHVSSIVSLMNEYLSADGWEVYQKSSISGRPVWGFQRIAIARSNHLQTIREFFPHVDSDYLQQQIHRMEKDVSENPVSAIGAAKDLIETVCKTILSEKGFAKSEIDTLKFPKLVRTALKELKLVPENISDAKKGSDVIKKLLNNFASIANCMRELRKSYGSGHGREASFKGLLPRHARLAVGSASTFATFLYETFKEQHEEK